MRVAAVSLEPPTASPPVIRRMSDYWKIDHYAAFEDGYVLIGSAAFTGPAEEREDLIRQAEKVDAELVFVKQEYLGSDDYIASYTTSYPVTSYHSGSIYGHGFRGSYSGTTTTRVRETEYYLRTRHHYNHDVTFYAKRKPSCLGLLIYEPTEEHLRTTPDLRPLVMVTAVRKGSPAAAAGFESFDMFHTVNGQEIASLSDMMPLPSFQEVDIVVQRGPWKVPMTVTTGDCTQPISLHSGI